IVSGSGQVPLLPPFKPAFVWPSMEPLEGEEGSTTSNTPDETPMNSSFYATSGWSLDGESRESYVRYCDIKTKV
ncbi:hypothetical protein MKW92_038170, partial [Papaver armeniacum]